MSCIQDGAQEHEDDELKADAQDGLFACFQGQEETCQKVPRDPCEYIQHNKEDNDVPQT